MHPVETPDVRQLFDAIVVNTQLPILVTRAEDGLIVYANDAYVKWRGKTSVSQLLGLNVLDIDVWSTRREREIWRDNVLANSHTTHRFGDTTLFTQLLKLEQGDFFISYNVDVSNLVQVEQEREHALQRLNRAQEIAKIGDFVYESATRRITGSPQLGHILGFEDDDPGIAIEDLLNRISVQDGEEVRNILNSNPEEFSFSTRYKIRDNLEIWIEIIGSVVRDDDGNMIKWEGTIQDISERKNAENEKERLAEQMQSAERMESLGLLAGGVAHDFNNLLVGIMGNADFALMEDNVSVIKERIRDVVTASQRATQLINQLLAYSGKGRLNSQPTNLSSLVREMSKLLNVSISENHKLQLFLSDQLPEVDADQTQIRQVVMNLILNASEAITHGNGVIGVKTTTQIFSEEDIETCNLVDQLVPGEYVSIEVSDNGDGITDEVMERMFEPFYSTKAFGRGLGISAVMGIVKGHAGAIKIYSEVGKGTTSKVFLPALEPAKPGILE